LRRTSRHAGQLCGGEVDLVGADAETTDREQAPRLGEHFGIELGARTDADDVRIGDAPLQFILGQRLLVQFDLAVAGGLEGLDRAAADAFEQQHADVLPRKRCSAHGG
jgi:hypothetical protein